MTTPQNNSKELIKFIMQSPSGYPRYFEVPKSIFRFFIIFLPIILSVLLIIIFSLLLKTKISAGANSTDNQKNQEIVVLQNIENTQLKEEIKKIKEELSLVKTELPNVTTEKNSQTSFKPQSVIGLFSHTSLNKKNQNSTTFVLQNFGHKTIDSKINITFEIANVSGLDEKLSGHAFIILKEMGTLQIYPQTTMLNENYQINYKDGEPFSVSRMRPFNATFDIVMSQQKVNRIINVIIFNKAGEIIQSQSWNL